jgi:hypothetical protein
VDGTLLRGRHIVAQDPPNRQVEDTEIVEVGPKASLLITFSVRENDRSIQRPRSASIPS